MHARVQASSVRARRSSGTGRQLPPTGHGRVEVKVARHRRRRRDRGRRRSLQVGDRRPKSTELGKRHLGHVDEANLARIERLEGGRRVRGDLGERRRRCLRGHRVTRVDGASAASTPHGHAHAIDAARLARRPTALCRQRKNSTQNQTARGVGAERARRSGWKPGKVQGLASRSDRLWCSNSFLCGTMLI